MSVEAITEFRQLIRGNAELEAAVGSLMSDTGVFDTTGAVELGSRHGFSFTEAEILSYEIDPEDELSDFELEMAAAGTSVQCVDTSA